MNIAISCCLCSDKFEQEIAVPAGWEHLFGELDDEHGFCPKHAAVAEFANSQCSGCVGGWMDCPLWNAFAYTGRRDIGPDDFEKLEAGICPRRVNGTMSFNVGPRGGSMVDIDLSERAPVESGVALAQAIRDYCARYPD